MKNLIIISIFLCVVFSSQSYAQTGTKETPPEKIGQNLLFNDIYTGYGAGSIFYFTGRMDHSKDYESRFKTIEGNSATLLYGDPQSFGTIFLGYQRSLNRVVSMGFLFGIQNFHYTIKATTNQNGVGPIHYNIENNDLLLSGIARFLFAYVNKPMVRMYSGIGIGITVDFGKEKLANIDELSERKLWPAGQLTLMGIRFGRAFGGFFEFGFGSYGIINAGVSYKFAD